MNRPLAWLVLAVLATAPLAPLHAQSASAQARLLAADFTKHKDAAKRKHGVVIRKYRDIVAVPWVAGRVAEYVGEYVLQGEPEATLRLGFDERGRPAVSGGDAGGAFELRNARIAGSMLTGQKVYGDGRRLRFEAAFLRRSERDDPSQPYRTSLGIGFLAAAPPGTGLVGPLRFFLVKQP